MLMLEATESLPKVRLSDIVTPVDVVVSFVLPSCFNLTVPPVPSSSKCIN